MAKKVEVEINENNSEKPLAELLKTTNSPIFEGELSVVKENVIHMLTHRDLLDFREFTEILYSFYDNEMKVYGGEFGVNDIDRYREASKEASKYLKVKELIFNEIKKRTDNLYEKALVQD